MKLIETTILETTVRMRYADNADPAKATQWVDFQVSLSDLRNPSGQDLALGDPEVCFVAEVRRSALRHVRDVIGAETQRLATVAGRIS
jgi:hypothetical protein